MNLRNTLLLGSVVALAGISVLYHLVNRGGGPVDQHNFRVGFLPVT
jgi:hypothetical protein